MDTPDRRSSRAFADANDPEQTLNDLPLASSYTKPEETDESQPPEPTYPPVWKQWLILMTTSLAVLVDVMTGSALFVVLGHIARDIDLSGAEGSWILTAYFITFAAFLMSAGRLADLSSAGWVFNIGIGIVAVLNLILSFLSNPIVFLVLRALQGIAAAMTIPSSYNITVRTFPEGPRRNQAIAILGLVASVSYSIGVIIGGLFEQASWRWLFRMISFMAVLATVASLAFVPKQRITKNVTVKDILLRMDPVGLLLSITAIIMLVLALTSGPDYGWKDARFAAALPVSMISFVAFFIWEAMAKDPKNVMLPAGIWKTPTVKPLVFLNLSPFLFWPTVSYGFPAYWQDVLDRSALNSAVRLLPIGFAAFAVSILIQVKPGVLTWRRWPIFATTILGASTLLLFIFSDGADGVKYWSYFVPASILGSAACQYAFIAVQVFVITSVPPEQAGVVGGLMSVIIQLGVAIGLAVQAACLTHVEGLSTPWKDYARGYWAVFGWMMVSVVISLPWMLYELKKAGRLGVSQSAETKKSVPVHF
ncbi:major facilitator superfamily domain-containing protein [Coprinopsis sp. MPI-PUGE-AT-0042]|nr:major facilitator superfamily domain-containing protein [Coprinopsis sp. MPI-PUGE-AT-0042]